MFCASSERDICAVSLWIVQYECTMCDDGRIWHNDRFFAIFLKNASNVKCNAEEVDDNGELMQLFQWYT